MSCYLDSSVSAPFSCSVAPDSSAGDKNGGMQADGCECLFFQKMGRFCKYNMPEENLGILGRQTSSCHKICGFVNVNLMYKAFTNRICLYIYIYYLYMYIFFLQGTYTYNKVLS